jgi:NADH-quinone oxidoreductase subunit C
VFPVLRDDKDFQFNMLVSVTAVDWLDAEPERFEVVYHFLSLNALDRLRVKVWVPETTPRIPTMSHLWASANYMERECWDMVGVVFEGHPDLRRILTYDEFKGHPLRKDYPVQGKQPRVKMRSPEVRNTALDMKRPPLVQINRNRKAGSQERTTGR